MTIPPFCIDCLNRVGREVALTEARDRELEQLGGLILDEGRRGHVQYIRVRRGVIQLGPRFWASRTTRALQEDGAVRLHTSTTSEGW